MESYVRAAPGIRCDAPLPDVVGTSPAIAAALTEARRYAPGQMVIVLVGEPGTGKSHFARIIHQLSGRSGRFEVLPAEELRGDLGSDVLKGHGRGAYTGAVGHRAGLLATAAFGTLTIEEFHDLPREGQSRLLRVTEERRWRPHGADDERDVHCRLIVCLCRSPNELVAEGVMSREIRSRLGACIIAMPTLAARVADIPALADHFLRWCHETHRLPNRPSRWAPAALRLLEEGAYPENLRSLRNTVEYAYAQADGAGEIRIEHLEESLRRPLRYDPHAPLAYKLEVVSKAVRLTSGNLTRAARVAGMSRSTLHRLKGLLQNPPV